MKYIFFLIIAGTAFVQSCKQGTERERIMLDSLDAMLATTAQYLDIDVPTIKNRVMDMNNKYNLMKRYYTDTVSSELGLQMQKYRSIMKVYKSFVSESDHMLQEQAELTKQVKNLRADVERGKLEKTDFRKYYDTEKADIETNLLLAGRTGKVVLELEPEYQRLSKYVGDILEGLAKENEELRKALE